MRPPSFFSRLSMPFKWLYRLPLTFSIPFIVISVAWIFEGFDYINRPITLYLHNAVTHFAQYVLPQLIGQPVVDFLHLKNLDEFFYSAIVTSVFLAGLAVAYNLAAAVNLAVVWLNWKPARYEFRRPHEAGRPLSDEPPAAAGEASHCGGTRGVGPNERAGSACGQSRKNPLADIQRIGIVLAGGGAKGAFQAGAMKAIHEFLAECEALSKVKVIASTSIGSWNALFWLANFIDPKTGSDGQSIHERWWRRISMRSLVAPALYLPFCYNAFLSSKPWEQVFDRLFDNEAARKQIAGSGIHFYMTRSNVRSGELECATNNKKPQEVNNVTYDVLDADELGPDDFLQEIKSAVFASMDLPPLFPYMPLRGELYEDGGVIDNLPLSFPATDRCNLLFVLSLNADFEAEPNFRSVISRLSRVLDVQQGALERQGFKLIYLYNELSGLRERLKQASAGMADAEPAEEASHAGYAIGRTNQETKVFAVCPQKSFVELTLDTRDLWNAKGARVAFRVMYEATLRLLRKSDFNKPQELVRVALISRAGKVNWDEKF